MSRPPVDSPSDSPDFARDQLELLLRHSPAAVLGNVAAASLVAWLLWGSAPASSLSAWLLGIAATMAVRARLARAPADAAIAPGDAVSRSRRIVMTAMVAGGLWGVAGLVFHQPGLDALRTFGLALALAGVTAVGPATIAAWPRAGVIYVLLVLLPLALNLAVSGGGEHLTMALMVITYAGVMAGVARRNHLAVIQTLELRRDGRAMQRSLTDSERRFEALAEATPSAMFIVQDERYVYVNPAACTLTGYPKEALLGMRFGDLVRPDLRDALRARARARRDGVETVGRSEVPLVTRSGDERWVDGSVAPLVFDGRPAYVITATDITERKAAEDALREARDVAESAMHAKSLFLATISHEIRTPLNGMLGMAQLLADSPLSAEQREQVAVIRTSGDALRVLIDDLLDLSKIEAGRLELEQRDFALRPAFERTLALYRPLIEGKGLAFDVHFAPDLPRLVRGDSTRLSQILSNLVSNALKFTHAGRIGVTVDAGRLPGGIALQMAVSDTGVGIAPDRLERLFKPFSQVDSSTTREFGGTGLGLSIARRLAEAMDGRIEVDSRPGEGSTFRVTVRLGAAQAGAPEAVVAPAARVADLSALKVLVAEDNPTNRLLAVTALNRMGVRADTANDGREALERAQAGDYDLILMDMQMPVMDGLDATRAIRALALALPRRPRIVALTANAFAADRERCLAAGMDDFLAKPLDLAALRAMLEAFAAGAAGATQAHSSRDSVR